METYRKTDMHAEEQLGRFMDIYFYSKIKSKDGSPVSFERYVDKKMQLSGVDVRLNVGNQEFLIDEKASIYYSNTMLPTFAFELDSIQKTGGAPVTGWFVRDDLVTQYYMLIWPNTKCKNINGEWRRTPLGEIEFSDFTIIEAMLIRKDDIFDFLQRNNLAKSHLLEYAKRLRATHGKKNEKIDVQLENRLSITFSGQIPEKPINLIIRREKLKEIAKQVYLISQDGFARIKLIGKPKGID